jgi:hypothetical protein
MKKIKRFSRTYRHRLCYFSTCCPLLASSDILMPSRVSKSSMSQLYVVACDLVNFGGINSAGLALSPILFERSIAYTYIVT